MSGMPLWQCPLCHEPLQLQASRWVCKANHSFDRAKEGYVNLLVVNRKHSADPGDNKTMLASRRYFLQQDFYVPLAIQLAKLIQHYLKPEQQKLTILDAGCGEGYYLNKLAEQLGLQHDYYGTDISRAAMRLAAKQYPFVNFAVASSFDLPLATNSVDVAIRIFAPADENAIARILKPGGLYLWVFPAEQHLFELRQIIYDDPKPHTIETLAPIKDLSEQNLIKMNYSLILPNAETIQALLAMTPYYWSASAEKQAYCQSLQQLKLSVHFAIRVAVKL